MQKIYIILFSLFTFFTNQIHSQCTPAAPSYNDPASQDGILELMNIPCAWTLSDGNPDIVVAAFDLYFDNAHDDLVGKVVEIVGTTCSPANAGNTHGRQSFGAVAGIRNNGKCIAGSGGLTKVAGFCGGATDSRLQLAYDHGYRIMAVSRWTDSSISKAKLEELTEGGAVILLAGLCVFHDAQNANGKHSVPGVIHVGRAKQNGDFSNYTSISCPGVLNKNLDVLVVADGLWRIGESNTCEQSSGGTSIGTPLLAGVVALMRDVNPCLSPADIEEILVQTAGPIPSNAHAGATRSGIIDAYAAVLEAQNFQGIDKTYSGTQTIVKDEVSGDLFIQIGADITISDKLKTGQNTVITLRRGSKLTITGTVEMGDQAKFIVKRGAELVVNGGTIINNECTDQWAGIVVEGNSNLAQQTIATNTQKNGVVKLIDATIENAQVCVTTAATHIPWPQVQDYRGGYISAINTTFKNTVSFTNYRRGIEFLKYDFTDNSAFEICTFDNVSQAVTHWANKGVTYDNCTFTNLKQTGILTYDANIDVIENNTFDCTGHTQFDQAGIDLYQTFPINGDISIGVLNGQPNIFTNGYHSIFSDGGNPQFGIKIFDNNFDGSIYQIRFDGVSNFEIQNNNFTNGTYANYLVSNGSSANLFRRNQMSGNAVGIFAQFTNSGYTFLQNCFDNIQNKDVRADQATLANDMGNSSLAASNVFSQGAFTRGIQVTGGSPQFNYHIKSGTPSGSRAIPFGYSLNQFGSTIFFNPNCSANFRDDSTQESVNKNYTDIDKLSRTQKIEMMNYAIAVYNSTIPSEEYIINSLISEDNELNILRNNIHQVQLSLIWDYAKDSRYSDAINLLKSDSPFELAQAVYGSMVTNNDYTDALAFLDGLLLGDEEEYDFVEVQKINLKRLMNFKYKVSEKELDVLFHIGHKFNIPSSGYARSLYRYITGEKIQAPTPELIYNNEELEKRTSSITNTNFKIVENPTSNTLKFSYEIESDVSISLFNTYGQLMLQSRLDHSEHLFSTDISSLISGLYIVTLIDDKSGKVIFSEKLMKI